MPLSEQLNKSSFTYFNPYEIFLINQYTNINLLHDIIRLAFQSKSITIDTESDFYTKQPALIQIELINKVSSTVLLVEVCHLPKLKQSLVFWLIRAIFQFILRDNKTIYCWGKAKDELKMFLEYELFNEKDLNKPKMINLQEEFHDWHYRQVGFFLKGNNLWGLQAAIDDRYNEYLDKSQRLNRWSRGLYLRKNIKLNEKINHSSVQFFVPYTGNGSNCDHRRGKFSN